MTGLILLVALHCRWPESRYPPAPACDPTASLRSAIDWSRSESRRQDRVLEYSGGR